MSLGVMPIRTIMLVRSYRLKPIYTCNSGSLIRLEEIKVILLLFSLQNQISTHTQTHRSRLNIGTTTTLVIFTFFNYIVNLLR